MATTRSEPVRVLGTLRAEDGTGIIRLEERFDFGVDAVWDALTNPRHLAQWLGTVEGDLKPGGAYRAHYLASGWEGTGRVVACERPHRFVVQTMGEDDEPGGMIEATLSMCGDQTVLVLEDRGVPLDQIAAYGAGNQIHLEDLTAYLAGRGRCDASTRWEELHPHYQALPIDGMA